MINNTYDGSVFVLFWFFCFCLFVCFVLFFISLGVVFIRRKQRFFKLRLTHIPTLNTGKLNFVSHKAV